MDPLQNILIELAKAYVQKEAIEKRIENLKAIGAFLQEDAKANQTPTSTDS